jgi:hypothetical protein
VRASWLWVLVLVACNEHGKSPPDGPGDASETVAQLEPDRISIDFGTAGVSSSSAPVTLTITNAGLQPSGSVSALITGGSAAEFSIANNDCAGSLGAHSTCALSLVLRPTSLGAKAATLIVSAMPGGMISIELTGAATTDSGPRFIMSPQNLVFAAQAVATSTTQTITVTNPGGAPTGPPAFMLAGTTPAAYQFTTTCSGALPAGGQCLVHVTFQPVAAGAQDALIEIAATPGGSTTASLSGTGLSSALLEADRLVVDFGGVTSSSPAQTITITNVGSQPSGALLATISGPDTAELAITSDTCSGNILAAQTSCTVTVRVVPMTVGNKQAALLVAGMPGGALAIDLRAVVLSDFDGFITASPTIVFFADQALGAASASQTITITNQGGQTTGPVTVMLGGANPAAYQYTTTCGTGLPVIGTCTIDVVFQPVAAGSQNAVITTIASPGGTVSTTLAGNGL